MSAYRPDLGAPGIYRTPPTLVSPLAGERLDACGFVGVAPRGPAEVPIVDERWRLDQPTIGPTRHRRRSVAHRVTSWAEYMHLYGGLAGPGRLPWAVRSFFDNGGVHAWIVRITAPRDPALDFEGVGRVELPGLLELSSGSPMPVRLLARNEGIWSNRMRVSLGFARIPLVPMQVSASALTFGLGAAPPQGSLLRATFADGTTALRFVTGLVVDRRAQTVSGSLSTPWPGAPVGLELVTAELWLDDGDGRREHHAAIGLSALHPRWLATVLCHESGLVWPDERWVEAPLEVDRALPQLDRKGAVLFAEGADRYAAITVDHFFDAAWDPRHEGPGSGIAALADAAEVASVVVPDLYHPQALFVDASILDVDVDLGSADWTTCFERGPQPDTEQASHADALPGLVRDVSVELASIVASQQTVVALAERLGIVALLDAPPGLSPRRLLAWRQYFASSWAAAYHPWLRLAATSEEPEREVPVRLGPAAIAAGILARRERHEGIPHGPANAIAAGVVDVEERVSPREHDELHPEGINVFLREREGVRLTAARTLSRDSRVRQLSVRRLMQLLHRTLARQLQWVVFEPNGAALRMRLRDLLRGFLRELHRQGAFRGNTEGEAFFVRCDAGNNPPSAVEIGELLAEIGVAPAEPLEFLVLALRRDGDGVLEVVAR